MSQAAVNGLAGHRKDPSSSPTLLPGAEVTAEVLPRAHRRRFSADYKRRILDEADQCRQPGQIGALLRREGLYSSHLSCWRQQRERGELGTLPRGKMAAYPAVKEGARLQGRLKQAETIIAVQKKLCDLLGLPSEDPPKVDSK